MAALSSVASSLHTVALTPAWHTGAHRLGSRLYYEFTATALGSAAGWERVADSVAVEVRRHGAPPPLPQAKAPADVEATRTVPQDAVDGLVASAAPTSPTVTAAGLAPSGRLVPSGRLALSREAAAGVSVVHNHSNSSTNIVNNSNANINNNGNSSIVVTLF